MEPLTPTTALHLKGLEADCSQPQCVCNDCQKIFDHWYARTNWSALRPYHLHHSLDNLEKSATGGCPVCQMLFDSIDDIDIQKLRALIPNEKSLVQVEEMSAHSGKCAVKLIWPMIGGGGALHVFPAVDKNSTRVGMIQKSTESDSNWSLIQKWLRKCCESHHECSKSHLERKLPTRLIHVGKADIAPCLCLSKNLPQEIQYLTLSHCWGKKRFTTLTQENYDSFLVRIPTQILGKTFTDAIEATRRLGFQYLWIDSLCIIQGDLMDWKQEAALMTNVYANSTLNLAAAAAPDGDTGCFSEEARKRTVGWKVSVRTDEESLDCVIWDCTIPNFSLELLNTIVLDSRAWVFQERFLAPRTLHFTKDQLLWECRATMACETFPDTFFDGAIPLAGMQPHGSYDATRLWGLVVTGYTRGHLTFSRDKLVAISGVARLFASENLGRYLAGMWEKDLVQQLAWHTYIGRMSQDQNVEIYRAPSWSWASIDGCVFQPLSADWEAFITIEEVFTKPSHDPFGDVEGGELRVKSAALYQFDFGGSFPFNIVIFLDRPLHDIEIESYLLPIFGGVIKPELWGVILQPARPDLYRRVAAFRIQTIEDIKTFKSILQRSSEAGESTAIGEPAGYDASGNQLRRITII